MHEAANRRLARDIPSLRTQPPFDASAMDGFAVRQADVIELPAELTIIGESRAGVPYEGSLGEGQAVRIFTGAVVPEGADTIIIQENTEFSGSSVRVLTGTPEGKFIRKAGLDFKEGEVILGSEDVLSPNRLALVASMNYAKSAGSARMRRLPLSPPAMNWCCREKQQDLGKLLRQTLMELPPARGIVVQTLSTWGWSQTPKMHYVKPFSPRFPKVLM